MAFQNEELELVSKLHERLMRAAVKQANEVIEKADQTGIKTGPHIDSESAPPAVSQEAEKVTGGADKINEIRNEVAAGQPPDVGLSPDKQGQLLEIIKQKYEEFKKELASLVSLDESTIDFKSQRFKNELTENVSKLLLIN